MSLQRALISVADKTNLVELAQALIRLDYEIVSTGGTADLLRQNNVKVTDVASITQFPEMLDGRVKTLHPAIHAGILARGPEDDAILRSQGFGRFNLIVVNLYPFHHATQQHPIDHDYAIEHIDIGGSTLIRAAAKNHAHVACVVDNKDYAGIIKQLQQGPLSSATRLELAKKAFAHTAAYDAVIANYFNSIGETPEHPKHFPSILTVQWNDAEPLRYGENPHQKAVFYRSQPAIPGTISSSLCLQGKALSYNNINDADCALNTVLSLTEPACVIVKHANPCGVASAANLSAAYELAYRTDPTSAFGGIIAFNRELDAATADQILSQQFVEVIIAPTISADALTVLAKKPMLRVLAAGIPQQATNRTPNWRYQSVQGGLLLQEDDRLITPATLSIPTKRQPSNNELQDALFANCVVKYVKSNAIVYAKQQSTLGIGAGQMSRIDSARIAAQKALEANLDLQGAAMASDAFFPFADSIEFAAANGITTVIQPGGSRNDLEVIKAADAANIAMIFTQTRHFRH